MNKKKEQCLTCNIPVIFCVGVPRLCRQRYERYRAKIAELKAKIESEQEEVKSQ